MRIAYADPPYPGMAHLYPEQTEVDHAELIRDLCGRFDGWALSTSSVALQNVLALCPRGVRIGAWIKTWAVFRPNVNPAYAWEPVIFCGGRKRERYEPTITDWVTCPITRGRGLAGAKPDKFCFWLFQVLNMRDGDEFVDLFPGTGAVTRAWEMYRRQAVLTLTPTAGEVSHD